MKEIVLSNGMKTLVDDDDYEILSQHRWHAHVHKNKRGTIVYAESRRMVKRVVVRQSMHRLIVGAVSGELVDHRDGDGLNNQRANLRKCTRAENGRNAAKTGGRLGTSKFKGVDLHVGTGRWRARVGSLYIGLFESEEDAARAYDSAAKELFGDFARANFY